jgi:hypothetical protein
MRQYARTLASPLPPETHDVGEGAQEVDRAPARRERSHCGGTRLPRTLKTTPGERDAPLDAAPRRPSP